MSPRHIRTFRIEDADFEAMRALEVERGIPVAEQVRRAIRLWLERERPMPARRKKTDVVEFR